MGWVCNKETCQQHKENDEVHHVASLSLRGYYCLALNLPWKHKYSQCDSPCVLSDSPTKTFWKCMYLNHPWRLKRWSGHQVLPGGPLLGLTGSLSPPSPLPSGRPSGVCAGPGRPTHLQGGALCCSRHHGGLHLLDGRHLRSRHGHAGGSSSQGQRSIQQYGSAYSFVFKNRCTAWFLKMVHGSFAS